VAPKPESARPVPPARDDPALLSPGSLLDPQPAPQPVVASALPTPDGGRNLKERLRYLYHGTSPRAARFQYALLAFDLVTIAFFLIVSFVHEAPWIVAVDLLIALVLSGDFVLRAWIAPRPVRHLLRPATVADLIVIVSLLAPAVIENLGFLRVLRALRLARSYHVLGLLRQRSPFVCHNEEAIVSVINFVVFIFFVTAVVYVTQHSINPEIGNYTDALYFTVTTLTTTGFGDITLIGDQGRLLSVLIMIFGISLFIRLAQTIFRPAKVRFTCPKCGLKRHDPDAVHCKHCGFVLNIPNEGE
jgi:voltage-gated potassium channel